ncbi:MAG: hypothetical protein JNK11_17125 [Alphaproteobacteria bacterium]|nr:hypothetical protein [Alphaproteobacteria bacterium]
MASANILKATSAALAAAQRGDHASSLAACAEGLGSWPPAAGQARDGDLELHFLACSALANLRRFGEANAYLDNLRPYADAYGDFVALRAACRHGEGRHAEALDLADKLPGEYAYSPMWAPTLLNIRFACGEIGAHLQRIDFGRILREAPDSAAGLLLASPYASAHDPARYLEWARAFHAQELRRAGLAAPVPASRVRPLGGRKIRIGYLTSILTPSGLTGIVMPLLRAHDRDRFDAHLIHVALRGEGPPALDPAVATLHTLRIADPRSIAEAIRSLDLDILVDTVGASEWDKRLYRIAYYAPAPIVALWLNNVGTSGNPGIGYLLGTREQLAPGDERFYSERLARLATTNIAFETVEAIPDIRDRPQDAPITFGCLAHQFKVTPESMALWARVLLAMPESRFVLRNAQLADPGLAERALRAFEAMGVPRARITVGATVGFRGYMDAYNEIDVALNTVPVSGGVTVQDGMVMGCPTVSLTGSTLLSRTALCVFAPFGLGHLCPNTEEGYIQAAVATAGDRAWRATFRRTVRDDILKGRYFKPDAMMRDAEAIFVAIVEAEAAGRIPRLP